MKIYKVINLYPENSKNRVVDLVNIEDSTERFAANPFDFKDDEIINEGDFHLEDVTATWEDGYGVIGMAFKNP